MTSEEKVPSKPKTSSVLRTAWPVAEFQGEGFPTITLEGTEVTSTESNAAQEAAKASGVTLVEGE